MNKQTLLFDLDDTLSHCNKYFIESKNEFVANMLNWFDNITEEEIRIKQMEIDIQSINQYGLRSSRYPESLVSTYKFFCMKYNQKMDHEKMIKLRKIGFSVFDIPVQPYPEMYNVLNTLKDDGHELCLYTGGDVKTQMKKVAHLELESYFQDRVYIFEHKNTYSLKQILNSHNLNRSVTWMIGNSLKTDIRPALEVGIHAVHIPVKEDWSYNVTNLEKSQADKLLTIDSLVQLPKVIRDYATFDSKVI
ncbi:MULTISPECIES: HAD family hydrolase [Bacillus]|uniref:HAD family hydrolase n=1 Tax=Bacillus TaxID=1386 RepID=UPI000302F76D|nr:MULTISPECIES: HAD hydrolase-like protein [Bacillus]